VPSAARTGAWLDPSRPPEDRARLAAAAMTLAEKFTLLHGMIALPFSRPGRDPTPLPKEAIPAAGYVPGVPRLGIPALFETDASLGIANPRAARPHDTATALPAGLALAATFDTHLAYEAGALLGREARSKGFNVLLGGGVNLARDPRNGRNFEYLGEDPLLAGSMAGDEIRGTENQHVISTVKHFALNANETNRYTLDARIDPAALRESDLLAFQIAIERGRPGAVMCAYNEVNGAHACGSEWLLDRVLKHDWGYRGWVMSDWGAVHGTADAAHGLDQESGEQFDSAVWFDVALRDAVRRHEIPMRRIDDMVRRILRSMYSAAIDQPAAAVPDADPGAGAALALDIEREGLVLLKNSAGLLPLPAALRRIAVIGGEAHIGVLSGGGSAQVLPSNGVPIEIPVGGNGVMAGARVMLFDPSPPLRAIQAAAPRAEVLYDAGAFPAEAAALAARCDVAIVFAIRHELEGYDVPDLTLPYGQDAVVAAVVRANPRTIVVLETGNPVTMPWVEAVPAVLAAWYPGQAGGQAIADVLFGAVNPSGHLPISFPRDLADTVRPALPNLGAEDFAPVSIDYSEGADVGYRWYARRGTAPLFAFGHGLSYTRFSYEHARVRGGRTLAVSFDVRNDGPRRGADVPQIYLTAAAGRPVLRLIGFQRVELDPGESVTVTIAVDPRLLGSFDEHRGKWRLPGGKYAAAVGHSAVDLSSAGEAAIEAQVF
jgi:beta-glucosidase